MAHKLSRLWNNTTESHLFSGLQKHSRIKGGLSVNLQIYNYDQTKTWKNMLLEVVLRDWAAWVQGPLDLSLSLILPEINRI